MVDFLALIFIAVVALNFTGIVFVIVVYATSDRTPKIKVFPNEKCYRSTSTDEEEPFPSLDDDSSIDLTVVIPAYNEEDRLPAMLKECTEYLEENVASYEVIVVDDGSRDGTTKLAYKWTEKLGSDKFRVLTLAKNLGKGGAVRRGMMVGRGKRLLFADADGATKFSELAKLRDVLDKIEKDGHGIVCGSRAHLEQEAIATRSLFRTILMIGFHFCVKVFGCWSIRDTQCGFKLVTRKSARTVFKSLHIERWAFDVELLKIAEMSAIPLSEVAVKWTEIDGSKLNPMLDSITMFKDLFLLWLRYSTGAWKLAKN